MPFAISSLCDALALIVRMLLSFFGAYRCVHSVFSYVPERRRPQKEPPLPHRCFQEKEDIRRRPTVHWRYSRGIAKEKIHQSRTSETGTYRRFLVWGETKAHCDNETLQKCTVNFTEIHPSFPKRRTNDSHGLRRVGEYLPRIPKFLCKTWGFDGQISEKSLSTQTWWIDCPVAFRQHFFRWCERRYFDHATHETATAFCLCVYCEIHSRKNALQQLTSTTFVISVPWPTNSYAWQTVFASSRTGLHRHPGWRRERWNRKGNMRLLCKSSIFRSLEKNWSLLVWIA